MPACFSSTRFFPRLQRDRRLVLRAGACLPTKDLDLFIRTAALCPEYKFVLALASITALPALPAEFRTLNRSLGSPVDIRVDVQYEEMAELTEGRRLFAYFRIHSVFRHAGFNCRGPSLRINCSRERLFGSTSIRRPEQPLLQQRRGRGGAFTGHDRGDEGSGDAAPPPMRILPIVNMPTMWCCRPYSKIGNRLLQRGARAK